jgi:hypothetical protein
VAHSTFLPAPTPPTPSLPSLFHTSRPSSRRHFYSAIGGIAFNILATSFGAIWLFCILLTWLPFRKRCKPSASFQLSDSSMRKTYFLPSVSRIEARRMCRCLEGCVPVWKSLRQYKQNGGCERTTYLNHLQRPGLDVPLALPHTANVVIDKQTLRLDLQDQAIGNLAHIRH